MEACGGYRADRQLRAVERLGAPEAQRREAAHDAAMGPLAAELDRLDGVAPGPELAAGLLAAGCLPLDTVGRARLWAGWVRLAGWAQAQAAVALHAAVSDVDERGLRALLPDLAALTAQSERSVGNQLSVGGRLVTDLPATLAAVQEGALTWAHARAVEEATRTVGPEVARRVDAEVVPVAIERGWRPGQTGQRARHSVLRLDPDGADLRHRQARRDRSDVTLRPDDDGMAGLLTTADAGTATRVMAAINAAADAARAAGDTRPLGMLRVDALAGAVLGRAALAPAETDGGDAEAGARSGWRALAGVPGRVEAHVLVDLPTLLGLQDNPGELDGYGPITAAMARELARDSVLRRLVTDPVTGQLVDLGRTTYRPSRAMRRQIAVRDRHCLFPGCCCRAIWCDIDHANPWPDGPTSCANCGLLCRRHHNLKTDDLWRLDRHADGHTTWTGPLGIGHQTGPAVYPVRGRYPDQPAPQPRPATAGGLVARAREPAAPKPEAQPPP